MILDSSFGTALFLAAVLCLGGCCRPALAQEMQSREPLSSPEASAHDLADEVMRQVGRRRKSRKLVA